jgi:hypothetical protein
MPASLNSHHKIKPEIDPIPHNDLIPQIFSLSKSSKYG